MNPKSLLFLSVLTVPIMIGCGASGDFPTGKVSGKVTLAGQPVTEGQVVFYPQRSGDEINSGKPARGLISSDGSYSLGTYGSSDGAVVGTHKVSVLTAPGGTPEVAAGVDPNESEAGGTSEAIGYFEETVTVSEGENTIDIDLKAFDKSDGKKGDDDEEEDD